MDVFDLAATLSLDKSQYERGLNEAEKTGSNIGSRIGAGFAKVGKAVTVGIGAASTAVGALASMSVKGYSDYEQLAGGVETLFKKSSQSVINNASKAYQTAGMSANEYMETVTGISASLIQSTSRVVDQSVNTKLKQANAELARLENTSGKGVAQQKKQLKQEIKELESNLYKTVKTQESVARAADLADQAVIDMSDNANKMGSDITSIQNAYQGFAKQNYTMLDNLKLGYGGTKEEMARLLSDAEKLSGQKFDLSSYADIVQAIHIVQTEMDITGTTAKEASTTIQGSLKSAKSAWDNLLTGLSDDNADLDSLIGNFFDSVVTVGENIIPRIGIVLNGITNMIEKLAPKIAAKLPSIFKQILPSVVKGATSLLTAFIGILPEFSKTIIKSLPDFIASFKTVFKGIVDSLPSLVKTLVSALPTLIPQVVSGIVDMAVYLMKNIDKIIQPIIDNLPDIIISIIDALLDNLPKLIEGLNSLVVGVVAAIPDIIVGLISALPFVIERIIISLIECLPQLINGLIELTIQLVAHLPEIIMGLIQAIPKIVVTMAKELIEAGPKIWEAFTSIFSNAWTKIQEVFAPIVEWFSKIFSMAWEGIQAAWNNVVGFFQGVWDGICGVFSGIGEWFSGIFKNAVNGIKSAFNGVKTWFQNLWNGIWNVIKTPINWIIDGINSLIDGLNSLSIQIPDWVPFVGGQTWGVNIPKIAKLAKGGIVDSGTPFIAGEAGAEAVIPLENNNQWIYKFAHAFADGLSSFYDGDNFTQTPNKGTGGKVVNINLYLDNVHVKNDDDIEDVANKVSERIAEKLVAEGMAVG